MYNLQWSHSSNWTIFCLKPHLHSDSRDGDVCPCVGPSLCSTPSQQLFDGLPLNFVQTFMFPREQILLLLWCFGLQSSQIWLTLHLHNSFSFHIVCSSYWFFFLMTVFFLTLHVSCGSCSRAGCSLFIWLVLVEVTLSTRAQGHKNG